MENDARERNSTAILICIVGLLAFNWPILSIAADKTELQALCYLYTAWILFIACLWWYCRRETAALSRQSKEDNQQ